MSKGFLENLATLYQAQATVCENACSLQRKYLLPLCGGRVVSVKGREAEHVVYSQNKPLLMSLLFPRREATFQREAMGG